LKTQLANLHDQNKSGCCGGGGFFSQTKETEKISKKTHLVEKKRALTTQK